MAPIHARPAAPRPAPEVALTTSDDPGENLKAQVQRYERQLILQAVQSQGSKRKAAQQLGIDIGTLIRKLQRD
ncbi:Bacterial regulatory protein, Fis family [compost metagenome]